MSAGPAPAIRAGEAEAPTGAGAAGARPTAAAERVALQKRAGSAAGAEDVARPTAGRARSPRSVEGRPTPGRATEAACIAVTGSNANAVTGAVSANAIAMTGTALADGDAVIYVKPASPTAAIQGLTDGTTYYVRDKTTRLSTSQFFIMYSLFVFC